MSGTTENLRRRISGAQDLETVVRSMKALAASSIGQYENAVQALNDYSRALELGLSACLREAGSAPSPALKTGAKATVWAVAFGSEQGLVGRFNEVLVEFVLRTLGALPGGARKAWAIGEHVQTLLADEGLVEGRLFSVPTSVNAIASLIGRILLEIEAARERGDVAEVHLFYNHPRPGALYEPVSKRLLPLDRVWQDGLMAKPWPTKSLPEIVGGTGTLPALIQEYLFVLLFQACAESLASENAARLAAMQRAEKNIDGILEDLNRTFHRVRQESIDEELFDVISGYEAMSKRHGG